MKLKQMIDTLSRITERMGSRLDDVNVVIEVHNPGSIGGTPAVALSGLNLGIDWDNNKLILHTKEALTTLTDEEREAVVQSVRKGQSWHAYQSYRKQSNEIDKLKKEIEFDKFHKQALELAITKLESKNAELMDALSNTTARLQEIDDVHKVTTAGDRKQIESNRLLTEVTR